MKKLIVANFKMHGTKDFIQEWFFNFEVFYKNDGIWPHVRSPEALEGVLRGKIPRNIVVALPAIYLNSFEDNGFILSGQNVSSKEKGAFTSQLSAEMLKDSGAKYCIIGHSETREELHESNDAIREKFDQLTKLRIKPIVCVGESLQIKETKKTKEHLLSQLSVLDAETKNLIVAYEPIWAIGTGLVPTETEIDEAISCIRSLFKKPIKVLYGGSVNASNAENLLKNTDIDGLLVGGASLYPEEFAKIAQLC